MMRTDRSCLLLWSLLALSLCFARGMGWRQALSLSLSVSLSLSRSPSHSTSFSYKVFSHPMKGPRHRLFDSWEASHET